ncbi:putative phosphatase regulatory subunit-domain-containing protein [Hysterangium stoloniferum]|nr:putative phosphatase regulatory subunit-domain-containing protein [Hysterangium stoloniferum]
MATTVRHHRRSASYFSTMNEGPGAFVPMLPLPRRKSAPAAATRWTATTPPPAAAAKKHMFQIHNDSSGSDDSDEEDALSTTVNGDDDGDNDKHANITHDAQIPFPTSTSPTDPPAPPPRPPTTTKKPTRPSLKSSNSSPTIPTMSSPHEPPHKNVHFCDDAHLASVRVFHKAGRPRSVSTGDEDTETETEGEASASSNWDDITTEITTKLPPHPNNSLSLVSESIPIPPLLSEMPLEPPPILLTSLTLHPPTLSLHGTLLALNVAYEKHVSIRFTLDEWATTSEVRAGWKGEGVLPSQWARHVPPNRPYSYDTFTCHIDLSHLHPKTLCNRTLLFCARYATGTGNEWWDNNNGKNYWGKIVEDASAASSAKGGYVGGYTARSPHTMGRSLSAPTSPSFGFGRLPTLRGVARTAVNGARESPIIVNVDSPPPINTDRRTAIDLSAVSKGTGFSHFALPDLPPQEHQPSPTKPHPHPLQNTMPFPTSASSCSPSSNSDDRTTPPASPYTTTKLTFRNYVPPDVKRSSASSTSSSNSTPMNNNTPTSEFVSASTSSSTSSDLHISLPPPPHLDEGKVKARIERLERKIAKSEPEKPTDDKNESATGDSDEKSSQNQTQTFTSPPLPTPPASRSSSFDGAKSASGSGASVSQPPNPPPTTTTTTQSPKSPTTPDTFAALLARWCFHTSSPSVSTDAVSAPRVSAGIEFEGSGGSGGGFEGIDMDVGKDVSMEKTGTGTRRINAGASRPFSPMRSYEKTFTPPLPSLFSSSSSCSDDPASTPAFKYFTPKFTPTLSSPSPSELPSPFLTPTTAANTLSNSQSHTPIDPRPSPLPRRLTTTASSPMPRSGGRVASLDDVPRSLREKMQTQIQNDVETGRKYTNGGMATDEGTSGQWAYGSDPGVGVSAGLLVGRHF